MMKKKLNPMSIVSLLVSVLGFCAYVGCFKSAVFIPIFFILTIASLILPPVAKKIRLQTETTGKWMEITAIVIAGYNFNFVTIYFLRLPDLISYLGWVVDGIVYHKVQYHVTTVTATSSQTPAQSVPTQKQEEHSTAQATVVAVAPDKSVSVFLEQTVSCKTVRELLDFWTSTPLATGAKGDEILEFLQNQANFERIYGSDPKEFERIRQKIAAILAEA